MQTKRQSLTETLVGIAIGFVIAVLTTMLVFPLFGLKTSVTDDILITLIFTVVSIIRSYYIRRFFNWYHNRERINA